MQSASTVLRFGLPKGRMQAEVLRLLGDAGLPVAIDPRGYRPRVGDVDGLQEAGTGGYGFDTKFLKPQNIVEMLEQGTRDLGFAGADWVRELSCDAVELLDTGLDPVRIVAAAPKDYVERAGGIGAISWPAPVVASEYETIARQWMSLKAAGGVFVRSYGATEAFPPEDADIIVDNCATGSTLSANGLVIIDEIMRSSTRLYASKAAYADPAKREAMESIVLLLGAVLEARRRVMIEMNVSADRLRELTAVLPCLRAPTVSPLEGGDAFAVKVAVPRAKLSTLIPEIRRHGATDILVSELSQLVP